MTGRNPAINTPLLENDIIVSINGIQLVDVEGGLDSWAKIFSSFSNMPRQVVVRRNAGVAAQDINASVGAGAPALTNNGPLVQLSDSLASNENYRTGILEAIAELKDRMGSSFQMIRDHMQSNMPPNREWSNGAYVKTLKKMTADGHLIHIDGTGNKGVGGNYKINQENNKNRMESAQKFEAAKGNEQVEMKKKQEEKTRISAAEGRGILPLDAETISDNLTLGVANDYVHSSNTPEMDMKLKKIDLFLEKRMALRPRHSLKQTNGVGHLNKDNSQDMEMKLKQIDLFLAKRMVSGGREIQLKEIGAHEKKAIELKKMNTQESRKIVENENEMQTDLVKEKKPQMAIPIRFPDTSFDLTLRNTRFDSDLVRNKCTYELSPKLSMKQQRDPQIQMQNYNQVVEELGRSFRAAIIAVIKQRGKGSQPTIKKDIQAVMDKEISSTIFNTTLRKMVNDGELVQKKSTYMLSIKLSQKRQAKTAIINAMRLKDRSYRTAIIAVIKQRGKGSQPTVKKDIQAAMGKAISSYALNTTLREMINDN